MILLVNLNLKNVGHSTFRYVMDCDISTTDEWLCSELIYGAVEL